MTGNFVLTEYHR